MTTVRMTIPPIPARSFFLMVFTPLVLSKLCKRLVAKVDSCKADYIDDDNGEVVEGSGEAKYAGPCGYCRSSPQSTNNQTDPYDIAPPNPHPIQGHQDPKYDS